MSQRHPSQGIFHSFRPDKQLPKRVKQSKRPTGKQKKAGFYHPRTRKSFSFSFAHRLARGVKNFPRSEQKEQKKILPKRNKAKKNFPAEKASKHPPTQKRKQCLTPSLIEVAAGTHDEVGKQTKNREKKSFEKQTSLDFAALLHGHKSRGKWAVLLR